MTCAIIYTPLFSKHVTNFGHPECVARAEVIADAIRRQGLSVKWVEPATIDPKMLESCHTKSYLSLLQHETSVLDNGALAQLSTGDVIICKDSFDVACLAVGAVKQAVDEVMKSTVNSSFAIVRPPGHHATTDRGMGFCLCNNVALGVRYVQQEYAIERVVVIDWDLHHGNGTEAIFCDDPSVLYFSTHQAGIYPHTGVTSTERIINCPIQGGKGSREEIFYAFEKILPRHLEQFQPQFFFISCGFDAHCQDPLGALLLTDEDFYTLTHLVCGYAAKWANHKVVSVLEGGYNLQAIQRAAICHIKGLIESGCNKSCEGSTR